MPGVGSGVDPRKVGVSMVVSGFGPNAVLPGCELVSVSGVPDESPGAVERGSWLVDSDALVGLIDSEIPLSILGVVAVLYGEPGSVGLFGCGATMGMLESGP